MTIPRKQPRPSWLSLVIAMLLSGILLLSVASFFIFNSNPKKILTETPEANFQVSSYDDQWTIYPLYKQDPAARDGHVAIGQNDKGIIIKGAVGGIPPKWQKFPHNFNDHEHLAIRITEAKPLVFPPVGWGHQFGQEELYPNNDGNGPALPNADTIKPQKIVALNAWYKEQIRYRDQLKNLFVREWHISPDFIEEVCATPAFKALSDQKIKNISAFRVSGNPLANFSVEQDSYSFNVLIPWTAFPPMQHVSMKDLRINISVLTPKPPTIPYGDLASASSGLLTSNISGKGNYEGVDNVNYYTLLKPRLYRLTRSRYSIDEIISAQSVGSGYAPNEHAVKCFFPSEDLNIKDLFVLDNFGKGYQYEPDPNTKSPEIDTIKLWEKPLGNGGVINGPVLSYENSGTILRSNYVLSDEAHVSTKALLNGDYLIMYGPRVTWTRFGSGQGGGNPRVAHDIYHFSKTKKLFTHIFHFYQSIDRIEDIDFISADDWSTFDVYLLKTDPKDPNYRQYWTKRSYRLEDDGSNYIEGKETEIEQAPNPRSFVPADHFNDN